MFMDMRLALLLFVCSRAAELEIDGEVSISLNTSESELKESRPRSHVTVGSIVECVYQYPEQKQVDAILSDMMNMLTKVFVRAMEFVKADDGRRAGNVRRPEKYRFKVIKEKETQFFESIYHNMTNQYKKYYNSSMERVDRAGWNPCEHQTEIKRAWRALLDHSLVTFRRAALRCVEERLRIQPSDVKIRNRLGQFLVRELGRVRSGQLHLLCDRFQLCFHDLV